MAKLNAECFMLSQMYNKKNTKNPQQFYEARPTSFAHKNCPKIIYINLKENGTVTTQCLKLTNCAVQDAC